MADDYSATFIGLDRALSDIADLPNRARRGARAVVAAGQAILVREAQAGFSGAHAKGAPHVGGDQPNVVTGDLRRSIRMFPPMEVATLTFAGKVGPTMIYGRAVELGLPSWTRGYPYMKPAAERARSEIVTTAYTLMTAAFR